VVRLPAVCNRPHRCRRSVRLVEDRALSCRWGTVEQRMSKAQSIILPTDLQTLVPGFLRAADVASVTCSAVLAYWLRQGTLDMQFYYVAAVLLGAAFTLNYTHIIGAYRVDTLNSISLQLVRTVLAWVGVMLTLLAVAYFTQTS